MNSANEDFLYSRYSDFADLAPFLCKYIKARDDVLMIGCGNSTLSNDLYDTGIEKITNIDLSEKVVKQMKKQNEKRRPNMNWLAMDAGEVRSDGDDKFSFRFDKKVFIFFLQDEFSRSTIQRRSRQRNDRRSHVEPDWKRFSRHRPDS